MLYLCKEGETYLDYKVTLEKQFEILFSQWRHYFCWRQHFCPMTSQKYTIYKNGHNFAKNGSNDVIFSQMLNIHKINIFWKFGENPTWWRHFMTSYVIFLQIFTKISEYVPFRNIKLWCEYEAISSFKRKLWAF